MTLSSEKIDLLLDGLIDPLNRIYRYPLARHLLKWTYRWPVTPDQVTVFHTLFSLLGAILLGAGVLWGAFLIYEIRAILNSYQRVLAREKNQIVPAVSRSRNALGDGVAFAGMMLGSAVYLVREQSSVPVLNTIGPVALVVLLMAAAYDFFKRKISSALTDRQDAVTAHLVDTAKKIHLNQAGWVAQATYVADWIQVCIFSPRSVARLVEFIRRHVNGAVEAEPSFVSDEADRIVDQAEKPVFSRLVRALSWTSGDHGLALLHLGLLTGFYVTALRLTMIYGILVTVVTVVLYQRAVYEEKVN